MRRSILVAMGLAGCYTRALPPDGGEAGDDGEDAEEGDDSSDGEDGSEGETSGGTSASTTATTDPTTATTDPTTATSASTSEGTSGTDTGIPTCEVDPEQWGQVYVCNAAVGNDCIPCDDDPECRSAAEAASDACFPEFQYTICGPELLGAQCCSVVFVEDYGCPGRPFIIAGEHRRSLPCARDDWRAGMQPSCDALDAAARESVGASWRETALAEHASIASFARFVLDLLAVGAPADLVAAAQRAMADEIVHARLAFGLASAYLGAAVGPGPLPVDGALGSARDLASIVRAVILEGCVGETVSAAHAELALEGCTDPAVRRALEIIARDERRHAQLAWQFVGWVMRHDPAQREVIADTFTLALVGIDLGAPVPAVYEPATSARRAHGVLPDHEVAAVTHTVAKDVIAPCFAALLDEANRAAA